MILEPCVTGVCCTDALHKQPCNRHRIRHSGSHHILSLRMHPEKYFSGSTQQYLIVRTCKAQALDGTARHAYSAAKGHIQKTYKSFLYAPCAAAEMENNCQIRRARCSLAAAWPPCAGKQASATARQLRCSCAAADSRQGACGARVGSPPCCALSCLECGVRLTLSQWSSSQLSARHTSLPCNSSCRSIS